MTAIAQKSFAGGEIAPSLYARTDQSKYAQGLRTCRNFMVMRHGGAQNRPGTMFDAEVKDSARTVRLIPFIFNNEQTYVMEFGHLYMRLHQDGAQVTETTTPVTAATQANPCVISSSAHGYSDGDEVYITGVSGMVELNGRNFKVANAAANTYSLQYMDGTDVDSTGFAALTAAGTAARIYTITTPYIEDHLQDIQFVQSADVVTLVHPNYAPQELTRLDHTSWELAEITLTPGVEAPTNVAVSGAGGVVDEWVVTSLKEETFEESLQSASVGSSTAATSGAPRTISWTVADGAVQYNIYKKKNGVYGFIGNASGTEFIDNGITADTTEVPPTQSLLVQDLALTPTKLDDPATLPTGNGAATAWSSDGSFLAVGHSTSPFVTIYQRSGRSFTKLTDPGTLPPAQVTGCAWSSDDQFLAVSSISSPFVTIYQRSGTTFTKLADPATLPAGVGRGCAWSPDDGFLVVAHQTSPFVTIYQRSGTTFTKLSNPASLPASNGNGCAWSGDGNFMSVAHATTPFITIYQRSGTTFTKLSNPANLPAGTGNGCAWSSDSVYLAVAHSTTPFITVYQRSGTTFAKLSNPADLPAGTGQGCEWSSDGQFLSVAHDTSPYVTIYQRNGTVLSKLSDPDDLPAGIGNGTDWSPEDDFLAVAHDTTPFITIYENLTAKPAAVSYYQQRLLFANTDNDPEKVWASRSAAFKNFTISSPIQDDDAVIFSIAGRQVNRVVHMVELAKLILFTSGGEWTIEGDSSGILRPGEINPKQHSQNGASNLAPIVSGGSAIYVQERGSIVRDLGFDFQIDGYRGNDLTIFSAHLFDGHTLRDWAYQKTPHSVIWAVRDDGTLLGLTYVREHELLAWHRHDFDGTVEQVCVVPEGAEDAVYLVIKREVDGAEKRYIERMTSRSFTDIVDAVLMDCAQTYDGRNTDEDRTMTLSGGTDWLSTETLTLTCSEDFFVADDVGNAIHLEDEDGDQIRFTIDAYTGPTVVTGRPHKTVPASLQSVAVSDWAKAVDEVTGLWHLEGKDVSVFADGFVVASPNNAAHVVRTVSDGAVTLDQPYAVIHVGLPITSDIETLDIDVAQGETLADKKKLITAVNVTVESSRGIFVGPKPPSDDDDDPLENLMEAKIRNEEGYDDPVALKTGVVNINTLSQWNSNGRVFIRQVDPIPLSVLAVIPAGLVPITRG